MHVPSTEVEAYLEIMKRHNMMAYEGVVQYVVIQMEI